jgi:hypothetical protein
MSFSSSFTNHARLKVKEGRIRAPPAGRKPNMMEFEAQISKLW